jgi:hypothetical protein
MNIYIRISENQKSISGEDRWNSYDKRMIIKKCWISLMANITPEDSLHVFHHDVSDKTLKWLEEKCQTLINFTKIDSIENSFKIPLEKLKIDLENTQDPNKLFALLEDDYLWNTKALITIKEAATYWKGFISPSDTPLNYINQKFSKVFVGIDRHWRTTNSISWNLIGNTIIFSKYVDQIKNAGINMNKEELNKILQETDCINPLPAVATHCKNNDMSPLVDWGYIWRGIEI